MKMFDNLIGENEESVIKFMELNGFLYDIIYTKSPRTGENKSEKRVIRIKMDNNNSMEILVGFFKPPAA